jgi:uncharacterized membrane protein YgcG
MGAYISNADAAEILQNELLPELSKGHCYAGLKSALSQLMERARAFVVPASALHQ